MSAIDPSNTTVGDLCQAALEEAGVVGVGQTALSEDTDKAWTRLSWMLEQWQRRRWNVYNIKTLTLTSTGALTYSVGPGGDFDTNIIANPSVRPDRLRWAQLIQPTNPGLPVHYDLQIIRSAEDFARIALPSLVSFPGVAFLDTDWPNAVLHLYPVAQANIYQIAIGILNQLPFKFANLAVKLSIPDEYFWAIVLNLALILRGTYRISAFPGDDLPQRARGALGVVKGANVQIAALKMPTQLVRPGIYNIFSDRNY